MVKLQIGRWKLMPLLVLALLLGGCAATGSNPGDPFESYNRDVYRFNEVLDKAVMKPIAQGYEKVIPKPAQKGVNNFFSNLDEIPTFINSLLQGNGVFAATAFWRFFINTTAGIGGLFDVASHAGLQHQPEDFGLTLAQWGDKESPYLMLPFLGPSTVRDMVGKPFTYYMSVNAYIDNVRVRNTMTGTDIVRKRANLLDGGDIMKQAALDPYVFIRNAYLQKRNVQIAANTGKSDEDLYVDEHAPEKNSDADHPHDTIPDIYVD